MTFENATSPDDRDEGSIRWGHEVSIGYFPQDHTGLIKKGLVYSAERGQIAFTVPHFGRYLRSHAAEV